MAPRHLCRYALRPAHPRWRASACAATSSGSALPVARPFDLPLVFLVLLAAAAAVMGACANLGSPGSPPSSRCSASSWRGSCRPWRPPTRFAAFSSWRRSFRRSCSFVLSEWIETRRQMIAICLPRAHRVRVGCDAARRIVAEHARRDAEAGARAVRSSLVVVKSDITVVAVLAPLALTVAWLRPRPLIHASARWDCFALLVSVIVLVQSPRTAFVTTVGAVRRLRRFGRPSSIRPPEARPLMLPGRRRSDRVDRGRLPRIPLRPQVTHDWRGSGRFALLGRRRCPCFRARPSSATVEAASPSWLGAPTPGTIPLGSQSLPQAARPEEGAVGLLCFLGLISVGLVMLARVVRSRRATRRTGRSAPAPPLIAFLTAALFELSLVGVWVTIVLLVLLGLLTTISRSRKGAACAQPTDLLAVVDHARSRDRMRGPRRHAARLAHRAFRAEGALRGRPRSAPPPAAPAVATASVQNATSRFASALRGEIPHRPRAAAEPAPIPSVSSTSEGWASSSTDSEAR